MRNHLHDTATYFDRVDGVKSMYSGHATWAKEKDGETIDTAVLPLIAAELASVRGGCEDPPAFESDFFIKERPLFGCRP